MHNKDINEEEDKINPDGICDPVCEKGSYSLSGCTCLVTHNLTCE